MRPFVDAIKQALDAHPHAELRLISNARALPSSRDTHRSPRSRGLPRRRSLYLQGFDIGLMPLTDNLLTRGKCGFKMILYMAVGCPVLASAVGANVEILEGSGAGDLVGDDPAEWVGALSQLIEDTERRAAMSDRARERAVTRYSVTSVLDQYVALFDQIAQMR